jgi:hypothetical protein
MGYMELIKKYGRLRMDYLEDIAKLLEENFADKNDIVINSEPFPYEATRFIRGSVDGLHFAVMESRLECLIPEDYEQLKVDLVDRIKEKLQGKKS